ncbi:MAG: type II CAAX endopeptidase family protein, partial [Oscillospiraceae bacterium]
MDNLVNNINAETINTNKEKEKALRKCSNLNSTLVIGFLIISNAAAFLLFSLFKALQKSIGFEDNALGLDWTMIISFISMYFITVPTLLLIAHFKGKRKFTSYYTKPQESPARIAKMILMGMGATYTASYIFNIMFLILQNLGLKISAPVITQSSTLQMNIVTFLMIGLVAPIFEELLFRGAILSNSVKFGGWFSAIITGVYFGLAHANYQQIFFAAAMGIFASYMTMRCKSIIPATILHVVINSYTVILTFVMGDIDPSKADDMTYIMEHMGQFFGIGIMGIIQFAIAVTGLVLLIIEIAKNRQKLHLNNPCPEISTKR